MNRRKAGVLTIEAAITLPLVVLALVALIFFSKLYYIQDQVHSALVKAAHDMAIDAYIIDELGVVDMQQLLYLEGAATIGSVEEAAGDISRSGSDLMMVGQNMTSFGGDVSAWFDSYESLSSLDDFDAFASEALDLMANGSAIVEGTFDNVTSLLEGMRILYEEAGKGLASIGLMEAVDFTNGLIARELTELAFSQYISDQQLENWGLVPSDGYIDFSMSSSMLHEDTIELVATYSIQVPFGNQWLGDEIPIIQKATARAWTGAYDSEEFKGKPEEVHDQGVEQIYYISTGHEDNHAYHFLYCLRKPLIESTYEEEIYVKNRSVCNVCAGKHDVVEGMPVYYVSETSKVHLHKECSTVYAKGVIGVTEQEAVEIYHREPCNKYNCVAASRGEE